MRRIRRFRNGLLVCLALLVVAGHAAAKQIELDAAMGHPVMLAGEKQTAYLRVAMTGFQFEGDADRRPVNVALVLDKSGSMSGEKIARAREAAIMAVRSLRSDDIVSVVSYDSTVNVVVPATKLTDKAYVINAIKGIPANGNTALFGGVSKGAHEVRKFLDENRVNRVVLLSDGLANVGPSSPGSLAELGDSLAREGVAVSTIGLGLDYNEDLMTSLARASDGNHMFAENAADLKTAFAREFGDATSVVAQDVRLVVTCAEGIRPVRALGREADITGNAVTLDLNQLYSEQTKYLVLEVEVEPGEENAERNVASVKVEYANMASGTTDKLSSEVSVAFTASREVVAARENKEVMVSVVQQIGVENNRLAMELRDQGKVEEGRQVLIDNVKYLSDNALQYDDGNLADDGKRNGSMIVDWDRDWRRARKDMQSWQYQTETQQHQGGKKP